MEHLQEMEVRLDFSIYFGGKVCSTIRCPQPDLKQGVFFSDPILRAQCVHTINAIDLRFFALYCGNLEILFGTKNTNLLQEIR